MFAIKTPKWRSFNSNELNLRTLGHAAITDIMYVHVVAANVKQDLV